MKRLLITGASGVVGHRLTQQAAGRFELLSTVYSSPMSESPDVVRVDLRNEQAALEIIRDFRPDVIIHAAASDRSVPMAETNRAAARTIARAAHECCARLVAISTDMVFDGTAAPYSEDAPPTPLNEYGRVKADNERTFLSMHADSLIVRTSLIYDLRPTNPQVQWMELHIARGEKVPLFVDEIRMPIWAPNFAAALLELAAGSAKGIIHVAGPEPLTRWQFGAALLSALGYDPDNHAEALHASAFGLNRPKDLTLDLSRAFTNLKSTPLMSVPEALRHAVEERI